MKEALVIRPYEFEIREVEPPVLKEGCAIIEIVYCNVCGSDLHVYEGNHPKVTPPTSFALGHEAVGYIKQISGSSGDLKIGDKVAVVPLVGCKHCCYCDHGYPNLCIDRKVVGFQMPGCLAEEVSIPLENLIKLSDDYDLLEGSLLEPLAVVAHSVGLLERVKHTAQDVVITGAGTIGVVIGLYLKENNGMNVHFVEINPYRKKMAEDLGFAVFENIKQIPLGKARFVAFECTGNKQVLDQLISFDPAPEVLIILGTFEKTRMLGVHEMCKRETFIIGSQMYTRKDLERAAQIIQMPFKDKFKQILVKRIYLLEEAKEAYDEALHSQSGTKVVIQVKK